MFSNMLDISKVIESDSTVWKTVIFGVKYRKFYIRNVLLSFIFVCRSISVMIIALEHFFGNLKPLSILHKLLISDLIVNQKIKKFFFSYLSS